MFSRRVSLTLALAPCWWSNQCKKVSVYVVLILIFCALPRRYKYYIQEYDELDNKKERRAVVEYNTYNTHSTQ